MTTMLQEREAARVMGLSVQTLRNWRHLQKGPPYVRLGKKAIRYSLEALHDYMEENTINPEARG